MTSPVPLPDDGGTAFMRVVAAARLALGSDNVGPLEDDAREVCYATAPDGSGVYVTTCRPEREDFAAFKRDFAAGLSAGWARAVEALTGGDVLSRWFETNLTYDRFSRWSNEEYGASLREFLVARARALTERGPT